MKGTVPLDAIDPPALADYARVVGQRLAKGHARTSGASMIAGYAGRSEKLDRALTRFARAYADQTEADYGLLVAAVRRGDLPARTTLSKAGPRSVHKSRAEAETKFRRPSTGTERPRTQHPMQLSPAWRCGSRDTTKTIRAREAPRRVRKGRGAGA
jgi:hypothetical protein